MTNEQSYFKPVIHRQTRRCKNHDYSARGIYMLTFVVKDRRPILGEVVGPLADARGTERDSADARGTERDSADARGTERNSAEDCGAGQRRAYIETEEFAKEREQWLANARQGVVTVTPGISKGEQILKADCLKEHLPLIHLQKEPIGPYWKPEESRFYACAEGSLLILAPWALTEMGDTHKTLADGTKISIAADSDYSQFHNMNTLAAEICAFDGEAKIIPLANARGTERKPLADARGAVPK